MNRHGSLTQFKWLGLDRAGHSTRGDILAHNKLLAKVALHQQGIKATSIRYVNHPLKPIKNRPRPQEITEFIRQLAALLSAHIPLIRALETLKYAQKHSTWLVIIAKIQQDIESGCSLAHALAHQPSYFKPLLCNLVAVGEQSSTLAYLLTQCATHQQQWYILEQQIKRDLAYPMTLLCLSIMVCLGLLLLVVPQFAQFFDELNAPLPHLTQWMLRASGILQRFGLTLGLLAISGGVLVRYFYQTFPKFTLATDQLLLDLPCIGSIIRCAIMTRLTATLSTALHAGLPLTDALAAVSTIVGNKSLELALTRVHTQITQGISLSFAFKQSSLFPHRLVELVTIGEESGNIEAMLTHLSQYYNQETIHLMHNLGKWLEPLVMTVLGCLIGAVIIAMYLPIIKLGAIV